MPHCRDRSMACFNSDLAGKQEVTRSEPASEQNYGSKIEGVHSAIWTISIECCSVAVSDKDEIAVVRAFAEAVTVTRIVM